MKIAQSYLDQLAGELGQLPNKEEILLEYEEYIELRYQEFLLSARSQSEAENELLMELGEPKEIAENYLVGHSQQVNIPKVMIYFNYSLFLIGACLTVLYYTHAYLAVELIWEQMVTFKWGLLCGYAFLLALMFFVHGRLVGFKQWRKSRRFMVLALLPNYLLMIVVLLTDLFQSWFHPLLNPAFLLVCVVATFIFYPLNQLAVRYGVIHSI